MNEAMFNPFQPWRHPGYIYNAVGFNLTALVAGVLSFASTVPLLATSVALLITFVLAIPMIWVLFVWARGLARLERSRVAAQMDVRILDPVPPLVERTWWRRLWERVRSRPRWKEIAHHVAALPVGVLAFALTIGAWGGSIALLTMPFVVDDLPGDSAKVYFFELTSGPGAWLAAAVGLVGVVLVAPWLSIGLARMQVALARALLGPSADAVHAAEVSKLETRRTAAVDSAESERRRIERDLHDGAQQRLVALAASLGAARQKLEADPEQGREMVAVAHEEAKAALKEIRDLVRGIHPVILEDRGLDAALSAVVARSPVPVSLDVQVAERPPAAIESAAYFVVNEALTNVTRHASATRAHVAIARAGDRLVIEVRDDGVGGANINGGSGLAGLRDRIAGMGGTLYVISPEGGPTTISVELPCGS